MAATPTLAHTNGNEGGEDLTLRLECLVLAQDAKIRELEEALARAQWQAEGSVLRRVMRYDDDMVARGLDALRERDYQ